MVIATTPTLQGRRVREYLGIVTGEAIIGANVFKDITAGFRDIVGGRSKAYENSLREAREDALRESPTRRRRAERTRSSGWTWTTRCWARRGGCSW